MTRRPLRLLAAALTAVALVASPLTAPFGATPAQAAGTPDLVVEKTMPTTVLYGETVPVTLTASNPNGPDAYNLSFSDILPVGASIANAVPAPNRTQVLADGTTLVVWTNVADLITGTTPSVSYDMVLTSQAYGIDSVVTNDATALANVNPRRTPRFSPLGVPVTGTFSASDEVSSTTTIVAFSVTKSEPSPEAELLRGVHDHQTVYTIEIQNNDVVPTSGFRVVDYLPAGLELLGCGGLDNSPEGTEETPGAGRIDDPTPPALTEPCFEPTSVTTVTIDPDGAGPLALGVYTRVEWDSAALAAGLGSSALAAGASTAFQYVAAVPLRENVQADLAAPTANLANNTGALTSDEQALTNGVVTTGTTSGVARDVWETHTVSAEDVAIQKSVDTPDVQQGSTSVWTMQLQSSEYALSTGPITVTDTLPSALDLVASTPTADSIVDQQDGTQLVTWILPAFTAPSQTTQIAYTTITRADYRGGDAPISSNDSWTNQVDLATDATIVTADDGTASVLAIVDESAAGQSARGVLIAKDVSNPVDGALDCASDAVTYSPETATGSYRPGDRVCWLLTVDFPLELDTLQPVLTDFLPDGFAFEGFAYTELNTVPEADVTFSADDAPALTWDLSDVESLGERFQVVVSTTIVQSTDIVDGDILANLAKLQYRNTAGQVFQLRDDAFAAYVAPLVTIDKSTTATVARGGDVVPYTVTVANGGDLPVSALSVRDLLPAGIECADVDLPTGASCVDATGGSQLQWDDLEIAAGASLALTYSVTLPDDFVPDTLLQNRAGVRQFETQTNTGSTIVHVPATNVDATLPPTPGTPRADDTAAVRIVDATVTKTQVTGIAEAGNAGPNQATIGETISYTVTATIPAGTTVPNGRVTDTLPTGVVLVGQPSATLNGDALPDDVALSTPTAREVRVQLPASYTNEAGSGDDVIVLTLTVRVADSAGSPANVHGRSLANVGAFTWNGGSADQARVNATIVEPSIAIAKGYDDADGVIVPGQTVTYTVSVSNAAGRATAHDLVATDVLPDDVTPIGADGQPLTADGPLPGGGLWNATARTITAQIPTLAPGATSQVSYATRVSDPLTSGSSLVNEVTATATSLAGVVEGERIGTTTVPGYQATASATLVGPVVSIAKSATPTSATIGESVEYTLTVTVPASTRAFDATIRDALPTGITYDGITSVTCDDCTPGIGAIELSEAGDTGTVGFFLGDVLASTTDRTVVITYAGFVSDAVGAGATPTNTATLRYNAVDRITGTPEGVPAAGTFDAGTNDARATVTIVEPTLVLDKDVAGQVGDADARRAKPGDTLSYAVTVTNTGSAPAYDVTVTDAPDERLESFVDATVLTQAGGIALTDGDATDGSLAWQVAGPIAAGSSLTIAYSLVVPAGFDEAQEVDGAEVVNTAEVPEAYGLPEETRDAEPDRTYPTYTAAEDVVEVELDLASIGDTVWFDVDGDGVVDAGEPRLAGVPVTVTYLGANGTVGGGDDESVTVATDANGQYLVERLPGGSYVVRVDATATAIAGSGLVASYDLDGGLATPNGVWQGTLGQADAERDVDFGYRGTGTIGDTVWFDQDLDGVVDATEAGIPDVPVTVTWAGPDGQLGTADDVAYPTTTGDDGTYAVTGLPAGVFGVAVALPAAYGSYAPVSDPDGGDADGASVVALAAGESNLLQDFGFAGTGSIGDRLWLDRDGDGVQDAGEPGLQGVLVELAFTGPGGEVSTFETTTGVDGAYLFANLPAGAFTVTVMGGLPANVVNSGDPDLTGDGDGDSTASGELAAGAAITDQDFGYFADTVLGDRVWWDIDGDGVQDAGEPGIQGVEVTATGPNGIVLTTTTDADGDYLFDDVADGAWTVAITSGVPTGFSPTFDADGGLDQTSSLDLVGADLLQDFGYAGAGSIGDTVWLDLDGDGLQSATEPGLAGVTVELTWAGPDGDLGTDDDVLLTTVTDADGRYLFPSLPVGDFEVAVVTATLPGGVTPTSDRDDTADGTTVVSLADGQQVEDADVGVRGSASIGDTVWLDQDGDGTIGDAEQGLSGVTVTLTWAGPDGELGTADDEAFTDVTDADGVYGFAFLPAGDHRVDVDLTTVPAGLVASFDEDAGLDSSTLVTLEVGEEHTTADFGFVGEGRIGDTVWLDLDGDGVQGATEPGVPNQAVEVRWAGPDGALGTDDDLVFALVTDEAGVYDLAGLPDGTYSATVVGGIAGVAVGSGDPDGGADSTATVTLGETDGRVRLDQDFGYLGLGSLGDTIWWDDDADGIDEQDEPRLAGVATLVTWFGPDGEEGTADDIVVPSPLTDADGRYLVTGLPDGSYSVVVTDGIPAGLVPSFDADDLTDGPDGASVVTLQSVEGVGQANLDQDFGYAGSGELGDTVWLDLDGDGVRGDGEPGLEGVTVTLTWAGPDGEPGTGDERVWTTQVADDGSHGFAGLPAGDFTIELADLPAGVVPTADPDGGDDSASAVTLEPGESNLDQDFGYVGDAGVGDTVWLDVDGDGVQDANEPGIAGVAVTVASPGSDGVLGTADDLLVAVVTDADGRYSVEGLPAATTQISFDPETLPEGTTPSSDVDGESPVTAIVTLAPGETRDDADFAVVGTQRLDGVVWVDEDGDGVRDAGEPGIPDVTVIVTWAGPDGDVELRVVTGEDGTWALPAVPAGEWTAVVDLDTVPERLVASTPAEVTVTVPVGGSASVEHGFVPTGQVGDSVWHDEDRDGVQDAGEAGIGGVTVILLDERGIVVAETVTAADGSYLFDDVAPGRYTVWLDLSTVPDGYVLTSGSNEIDVTVGPGESVLTADFPLAEPPAAPIPGLPQTGQGPDATLLIGVLLLLTLGTALVLVGHRRRVRPVEAPTAS